ncbi:MAG: hypothetical protein HPY61_04715 [Methanotrichaceae archaeon]|nr:hypothetical protein [Methanotrichaceae archaeon]
MARVPKGTPSTALRTHPLALMPKTQQRGDPTIRGESLNISIFSKRSIRHLTASVKLTASVYLTTSAIYTSADIVGHYKTMRAEYIERSRGLNGFVALGRR